MGTLSDKAIEKHRERLYSHYKTQGLSDAESKKIVDLKILRLNGDYFDDYQGWLRRLIRYLDEDLGLNIKTVLDLGCGTGEFVSLFHSLGKQSFGSDIYESEVKIAQKLSTDIGIKGKNIFLNLDDTNQSFDLVTMFSVVEHLDPLIFERILDELHNRNTSNVFIFVPNKFKIKDDHTGLPFLGVIPRYFCLKIVSITKRHYKLSKDKSWDVWYRSANQIEAIAKKCGFEVSYLPDKAIYPTFAQIPLIGDERNNKVIGKIVSKIYKFFLILFSRNKHDRYPYLNMLLSKK